MAVFNIKKGKNLPIEGFPVKVVSSLKNKEKTYALNLRDFNDIKLKLEVKEGDHVKVGDILLSSRENEDLKFTSPAGGIVKEIIRGEKRKLLDIVIEVDSKKEEPFKNFPIYDLNSLETSSREELVIHLLHSGIWPFIRQRPFDKIADPSVVPSSIFINAMDSQPNSADKQFLLQNKETEFQVGSKLLNCLAQGNKVYLCYDGNTKEVASAIKKNENVEIHQFKGAHPSGNVSTHIAYLDRLFKNKYVWYISAENVALLGELLITGKIPLDRMVALGGSSFSKPHYVKTRLGSSIKSIVKNFIKVEDNARIINGTVLNGTTVSLEHGFLGFYNTTITAIPQNFEKELFGWMKPGINKHSFTNLFLSKFFPNKKFEMNTKIHGESRAIVFSDWYDQFVTLDIHTSFLIKACLAEDFEAMEELGILECAPEDFSLCNYACISKLDIYGIIKDSLKKLEKES